MIKKIRFQEYLSILQMSGLFDETRKFGYAYWFNLKDSNFSIRVIEHTPDQSQVKILWYRENPPPGYLTTFNKVLTESPLPIQKQLIYYLDIFS